MTVDKVTNLLFSVKRYKDPRRPQSYPFSPGLPIYLVNRKQSGGEVMVENKSRETDRQTAKQKKKKKKKNIHYQKG
jgi:hypothetical protein